MDSRVQHGRGRVVGDLLPDDSGEGLPGVRPEPEDDRNPTGWFGDVRTADQSAAGQTATVYAICIELND